MRHLNLCPPVRFMNAAYHSPSFLFTCAVVTIAFQLKASATWAVVFRSISDTDVGTTSVVLSTWIGTCIKKKWLFKVMIQIRTMAFSIVLRQRRFSHVETVMFSDEELINRWKAGLWNKMYLNSILKGSFLCVKTFQPITTVVNKDYKSFMFSNVPHIGLL